MLFRVENTQNGNVIYIKCSGSYLFEVEGGNGKGILNFVRVDENKWPYNEVEPDIDLTTGRIDNIFWLESFLF